MPNWCECELTVTGPEADLTRFKETAREKYPQEGETPRVLDENSFLPYPAKFRKKDERRREWAKENSIGGDPRNGLKEGVSYSDCPKDGFNSGGYEWCIANWGTKWGICEPAVVEESPRLAAYTFSCAWGPCLPVIEKMGEMFPTLRFVLNYYEGGMCFQGTLVVEDGETTHDESREYNGNRGG